MKKYKIETKKAIFINGQKMVDFELDNAFRTKHGIVGYNKNMIYLFYKNEQIKIFTNLTVASYPDTGEVFEVVNPKTNEKGLLKEDGSIIVPVEYDYVDYTFSKKVIYVEKKNQFGAYNFSGKVLLSCTYDNLTFQNECIIAEKNFKFGLYSYTGKELLPVKYDSIDSKGWKHFFYVKITGLTGLFVKKGYKFLFQCKYKGIYYDQKHDVYIVEENDFESPHRATVFNSKGKAIIPFDTRKAADFILRNDFILVRGFLCFAAYSYEGKILVPFGKYEDINIKDGVIMVKDEFSKWKPFKKLNT